MVDKGLTECIETAVENKIKTLFLQNKAVFSSDREDENFEIVMER